MSADNAAHMYRFIAGCICPDQALDCTAHNDDPAPRHCTTRTPEPHRAGEFPMSCYACHIEADS